MSIFVRIDSDVVPVDRAVFTALFEESVVSRRAPYLAALESGSIPFEVLVDLARKAQIPYPLFFAPLEVVEAQLKRKTGTLLAGVGKEAFSMNSRSQVRLYDVELIIKDLLRKQQLLKKLDETLVDNRVVGCIRRSRRGVVEDAATVRSRLGFTTTDLQSAKNKQAALDLLIARFEAQQVLVSQSQQNYMPQLLRGLKLSGLCVRDKKVPYVFLASGDEGGNPEPTGRRIFTLVLLAVFAARGRFAPVTYNDQTPDLITGYEYELTEEILMPAPEVREFDASSLVAVKDGADHFRVTPSAFVMRALRIGLIEHHDRREYLDVLTEEFANQKRPAGRSPNPINAIRKYNGAELSRRMVAQLDLGTISASEFRRVVCLNNISRDQISEFKAAL